MIVHSIVMGGLAPVVIALTLVQRLRGRVPPGAVAQRLGLVARPLPRPPQGPSVWLHGASNGELTSAAGVLRRIIAARPDVRVLVTANTATAVALVQGWGLPGVQVALAPIDSLGAAGRVLRRWNPAALVVVENELWPARLAAAEAQGVPIVLIGGRMSVKSARGWARFAPGLMRAVLRRLTFVSPQDAGSAVRLVGLGLPPERLGPAVMLKSKSAMPAVLHVPIAVPRDRVMLAASTHPGEEALAIQAFAAARGQFDLLILAPRHPRRSVEVAGMIAAAGLTFAQRSQGAVPTPDVPVFLADTMGEMPLWYAMAGVTVIGGSFVPRGGHTPYEPAAAGSAILHGPYMENFETAAAALARSGGALAVSRGDLAHVLSGLDAARQARLATAAHTALPPDDGVQDLVDRVLALLPAARYAPGSADSG